MPRCLRAALLLFLSLSIGCTETPAPEPANPPPATAAAPALSRPIAWPGVNYAFQQGDAYFSSQPSAAGLRHAAAQGVRTVVNLRDDDQGDVPFDEAALVKELGLAYRHVPINGARFTKADVAAFGKLLQDAQGPVLIHCRSSNRVGGLWASHLVGQGRITPAEAVEHGRAAGLRAKVTIERTRLISSELANGS